MDEQKMAEAWDEAAMREAGDIRLLTAIREVTDTRVDEDREREAA